MTGLDDDVTFLPLFLALRIRVLHTFFAFLPEAEDLNLKYVSQLYSPSVTIFYCNALRVTKFGALDSQSSLAVRFLALAKAGEEENENTENKGRTLLATGQSRQHRRLTIC